MGVDRHLYTGYYLALGKINIAHQEAEVGCDKCKTHNSRDEFCSKCGSRHVDYSRDVKCRTMGALVDLAYDREEIDGETHDIICESFLEYDKLIIPHGESDAGIDRWVNSTFVEITEAKVNEGDARDYFQPYVKLLDLYKIPYEFKRGILFYAY